MTPTASARTPRASASSFRVL